MKPGFLLLAISIIALQLIPNVSSSQALAFGWNGSIDTDLDFSEFFNGNFTINIRYLQQYPHAYYGPMVAENGDGNFIIGQGDYFGNGSEGDKLYIQIGNKTFSAKTGGDNTHWKDLVLVAQRTGTDINCKVYLNGNSIGSLSVPANDPNLPKGKIRFGKRTDAKLVNNATGQFYGLLDDIGFYNKAYSEQEVQALLNHPFQLTGTEPNVVAAYTFDNSVAVPAFKRKITRNGFIKSVAVSANRNGLTDLAAIPLPDYHTQMILPFPPGEAWLVIQGQDDASGSHKGYAAFCWDFMKEAYTNGNLDQSKTKGAPFYASAAGTVIRIDQSLTNPAGTVNLLEVQQANKEVCGYLHLLQNSSFVKKGDKVTRSQKLALTGDVGAPVGAFHLHLAVTNESDHASSAFVTYPVAFVNYEKKDGSGKWIKVAKGIPQKGEIIRNPAIISVSDGTHINVPMTNPAKDQTPGENIHINKLPVIKSAANH